MATQRGQFRNDANFSCYCWCYKVSLVGLSSAALSIRLQFVIVHIKLHLICRDESAFYK